MTEAHVPGKRASSVGDAPLATGRAMSETQCAIADANVFKPAFREE